MIAPIGNLMASGTAAMHTIVQRVRNFSQPPHAYTVIQEQGSEHVPRRWQRLMRFLPCVSAKRHDVSRRNSVVSVEIVVDPYFIEGNACPMTHPATSNRAKAFYDVFGQPELFSILMSHLDAPAATNLLLTRKHPPEWIVDAVKALPNRTEQARFLGATGSFAKSVRELMTDTHLEKKERIVSTAGSTEKGLLAASESASNAAWLAPRVPLTKTGSPPRYEFMLHALSWLAKFGPNGTVFNMEKITGNSKLAAKVRQTLENLVAAAMLPDVGPYEPRLDQAKDWVINYAHAYLEYSPIHDSGELIEFLVEKITTDRRISSDPARKNRYSGTLLAMSHDEKRKTRAATNSLIQAYTLLFDKAAINDPGTLGAMLDEVCKAADNDELPHNVANKCIRNLFRGLARTHQHGLNQANLGKSLYAIGMLLDTAGGNFSMKENENIYNLSSKALPRMNPDVARQVRDHIGRHSVRLAEQYAAKFADGSTVRLHHDMQMRMLGLMQVITRLHHIDTPAISKMLSRVTETIVYDRHNDLEQTLHARLFGTCDFLIKTLYPSIDGSNPDLPVHTRGTILSNLAHALDERNSFGTNLWLITQVVLFSHENVGGMAGVAMGKLLDVLKDKSIDINATDERAPEAIDKTVQALEQLCHHPMTREERGEIRRKLDTIKQNEAEQAYLGSERMARMEAVAERIADDKQPGT